MLLNDLPKSMQNRIPDMAVFEVDRFVRLFVLFVIKLNSSTLLVHFKSNVSHIAILFYFCLREQSCFMVILHAYVFTCN
jgi:hypothetical protein